MPFDIRNLNERKDFSRNKSTQTVWNKRRWLTIDRTPTGPPGSMGETIRTVPFTKLQQENGLELPLYKKTINIIIWTTQVIEVRRKIGG